VAAFLSEMDVFVVHAGSAHFGAPAACLGLIYVSVSRSTLITSGFTPASFSESSLSASSCDELDSTSSGTLMMSSWSFQVLFKDLKEVLMVEYP